MPIVRFFVIYCRFPNASAHSYGTCLSVVSFLAQNKHRSHHREERSHGERNSCRIAGLRSGSCAILHSRSRRSGVRFLLRCTGICTDSRRIGLCVVPRRIGILAVIRRAGSGVVVGLLRLIGIRMVRLWFLHLFPFRRKHMVVFYFVLIARLIDRPFPADERISRFGRRSR